MNRIVICDLKMLSNTIPGLFKSNLSIDLVDTFFVDVVLTTALRREAGNTFVIAPTRGIESSQHFIGSSQRSRRAIACHFDPSYRRSWTSFSLTGYLCFFTSLSKLQIPNW
jgi:hypothetical protein